MRLIAADSRLLACVLSCAAGAVSAQVSLTGGPYSETFNGTLASSGTSSVVPTGWAFAESGTGANTFYTAGTGSSNTGDTYSFGGNMDPDRAFGGLQSGSLIPTIGAQFVNNTGQTITELVISYTGEQWRLGALNRVDRIDFQYSVDAASLTTGTWLDVDALDFTAPVTSGSIGLLDGNQPSNRTGISRTITGLNIGNGSGFWIRWTDLNATGSDDGLAVDDFGLTPITSGGGGNVPPLLSYNPTTDSTVFMNGLALVGNSANNTIVVTPSGGSGAGAAATTTLNGCILSGAGAGAFGPVSGINLSFVGDVTTSQILNLSCTRAASTQSATLSCNETAGAGAPVVRSWTVVCRAGVASTEIWEIQGSGFSAALTGTRATLDNVVTARAGNGFYMQTPDSRADGSLQTSNGIFVFTSVTPTVNVGDRVNVSGPVIEFSELTEFSGGGLYFEVIGSGAPLPAPIGFDFNRPSRDPLTPSCGTVTGTPTDDLPQTFNFECFEGMRVAVTDGIVSSSAVRGGAGNRFGDVGVTAGNARLYREPGLINGVVAAPGAIPIWDGNPERFEMNADLLLGPPERYLPAGTRFVAVGVLSEFAPSSGFPISHYEFLPTDLQIKEPNPIPRAVPVADELELTVSSINVYNLCDTTPGAENCTSDPPISLNGNAAEYNRRINKLASYLINQQRRPDVIALQEIENLAVVNDVGTLLNGPHHAYVGYLVPGNDIRGINNAYLVNSRRVGSVTVTQLGGAETGSDICSGTPPCPVHDRPPLLLEGEFLPLTIAGLSARFAVMNNHTRSLSGLGDCTIEPSPARICRKRLRQAQSIAAFVQDYQLRFPNLPLLLVGDYNSYYFSDGHVDVIGQIKGEISPIAQQLSAPVIPFPPLENLIERLPQAERYSFIFDGSAQVLDQVLVNQVARPLVAGLAFARGNADAPQTCFWPNAVDNPCVSTTERLSDHDGPVLRLFRERVFQSSFE